MALGVCSLALLFFFPDDVGYMMLWTSNPLVQSSAKGLNPSPIGLAGLALRDFLPSAMPGRRSLLSVRPINLRGLGESALLPEKGKWDLVDMLGKCKVLTAPKVMLETHGSGVGLWVNSFESKCTYPLLSMGLPVMPRP